MSEGRIIQASKMPEQMNRVELLAYIGLLEQSTERANAAARRAESDAVLTIACLVLQRGGEATIERAEFMAMSDYQIASERNAETQSIRYHVRRKEPTGTDCSGTQGVEGQTGIEGA